MSRDYYAKDDIYGKNGVLLLGKGQKVTGEVVTKLKRLGVYKPDICNLKESNEKHDDYNPRLNPGSGSEICFENGPDYAPGHTHGYHPENYPEYCPGSDTVHDTGYDRNYIRAKKAEADRIINALKIKTNIHDDHVLELPNKVLNTIIFDSKTEPWWIHVSTLTNYVDWVYSHSIDVAIISLIIAGDLGYNDKELWNIGLGAFLHDVGKLLIPKDILQKSRELDTCDTSFIRQHCELGMVSLEPYRLAKECTDIIIQHHERLDGSGYPHGLKGSEICRNARIVMVADAFDEITSSRPYKKQEDADSAIRMLRNEGAKYPQDLVALLEEILK